MAPVDLWDAGLPQTFNFLKKCGICKAQCHDVCLYVQTSERNFLRLYRFPTTLVPTRADLEHQEWFRWQDPRNNNGIFFLKIFSPPYSHHRSVLQTNVYNRGVNWVSSLLFLHHRFPPKIPCITETEENYLGNIFILSLKKKSKLGGWMTF